MAHFDSSVNIPIWYPGNLMDNGGGGGYVDIFLQEKWSIK